MTRQAWVPTTVYVVACCLTRWIGCRIWANGGTGVEKTQAESSRQAQKPDYDSRARSIMVGKRVRAGSTRRSPVTIPTD
ncbi:hypothetical protein F5141DRAFT_1072369 [Pisolithus sp. B1]|nr:hypothetical protein F5141DRAFT_1072369 [Pisolithus sp. B1]